MNFIKYIHIKLVFVLLLLISVTNSILAQTTTLTITTTGAGSWTAPCGVTNATVICIGAGGGGGGGNGSNKDGGGGGGGGGCALNNTLTITGGTTYNYTVGSGGNGGAQGANGTTGGFTQMIVGATTVKGFGGVLGNRAANGAGGAGGTASGGTSNFSGGNGANGVNLTGSGGGGEGASSSGIGNNAITQAGGTGNPSGGDGGAGKTGNNGVGSVGTAPGGGGGGGNGTGTGGGSGGNGQIVIIYTTPTVTSNAGPDQTVCVAAATLAGNTVAGYTGAWTCITNCGGVSITTPASATSGVTGLTSGVATTFQWTLTETATGCVLSGDQVIVTRNAVCPPSNDDPSSATPITAGASCSYTTFTNAGATASSCSVAIPAPTCASYSGADVWFSVTVPASGAITFSTQSGVITDGGMAIYSGTPCGSLTQLSCSDDVVGNMPAIALTGQTPGATLYIRVWEFGNDNNGTFGLCATSIPPPSNDNCSGATAFPVIPTDGTCANLNNQSSANATASGVTPTGACTSNTGDPDDDVWFSFVASATSHQLTATNVSGNANINWQVFSGSCAASMTSVFCTATDAGGLITGLTIGQTYYVRMYTNGTGNNTVQNICLSTPVDPCTSPTNIGSCGTSISTTFALGTGSYGTSACGFTTDGYEKIFTFTPATSGNYNIQQGSSFDYIDYQFKLVSAGCSSTGWTCVDDISGAGTSSTAMALTAGVQYYILLDPESTAGGNVTFTINCPPADPCTTTTNVATCGTSISTNFASGTGLYGTSGCGWTTGGVEKIFTFTPATTGNYFIQQGSSFALIDYQFKLVSAGCSSTGWTCVDDLSGASTSASAMALTAGVQYYILLDPESTAGGNVTFTINCPPTPPANNDCPGATPAPVSSGTTCATLTNGTLLGATASTQTTSCVSGNTGNDVWYSFVAGASSHSITINHVAGNETDLYHSVYAGACGTLGTAIVCSDPNNSTVNGLILGNTYYIRVYTYYSAPNANTTFSVCIKTGPPTGPCGNPANNDYCSNPATLTQGAGTFSSTTSSIYSADQSTPLSGVFCGSIENNSWYSFIATSATASFPFTSISGCTWNDGVQAQVYSVTTNTNGCCSAFTSVSNCYNPGTTSTGTVTATGLVNGQTYILMVDGWGGDVCNFTVSGWTAVGILPLELLTFVGHNEDDKNKIQWVTSSEKNTNFFRLEKSKDGVDFEKLLDYNAAGNSESTKYYNAFDLTPFEEMTYYRLKLFNLDGTYEYSNIITINNKNLTEYITSVRPNPTKGDLEFDVNVKNSGKILIEIYNPTGVLINSSVREVESGYKPLTIDLNKYDAGIYLLKITFENSGKSEIQKIIKN